MSVFTKVLFVASGLFIVGGVVTGWVFHVPGGGGHSAWELANTKLTTSGFGNGFYAQQSALGTSWMVPAYILLGVGVLLFVIAVIAAFMNVADQNRRLRAAAWKAAA